MKGPGLALVTLLVSCSWQGGGSAWNAAGKTGCRLDGLSYGLPDALRESSGAAWSISTPEVWFTHNDGGHDEKLYVLNRKGEEVAEIPLLGAANRDWEDLATGRCGDEACIYIADVGDNQEVRERVVVYRLLDPGVYDGSPQLVEAFPMRLPDGPRDMEALFVLPGEQVFLVSKGRNHGPTLYRYPPPLREGEEVTLESLQQIAPQRLPIPQQITGADASPDGRFVVLRTYQALRFYSWDGPPGAGGRLQTTEGGSVALRTLNEPQGEGVGLGPEGSVVLTSEALLGRDAMATFMTCTSLGGQP